MIHFVTSKVLRNVLCVLQLKTTVIEVINFLNKIILLLLYILLYDIKYILVYI